MDQGAEQNKMAEQEGAVIIPQFKSFWPAVDGVYPDDDGEPGEKIFYDGAPEMWGKYYWAKIHLGAYFYPENPNKNTQQAAFNEMDALRFTLPCGVCRDHYRINWKKYPICEYLVSRAKFIEWTIIIRDSVHESLKREPFDFKRYLNELTGTDAVADDGPSPIVKTIPSPAHVDSAQIQEKKEEKKDKAVKKEVPSSGKQLKPTRQKEVFPQHGANADTNMLRHAHHVQQQQQSLVAKQRTASGAKPTTPAQIIKQMNKVKQQQKGTSHNGGGRGPSSATAIAAQRRAEAIRSATLPKPKECPNCQKRFFTPSSF